MALMVDIADWWRAPRRAMAARLKDGVREDRALATAMGASALVFVAQLPGLARQAVLDPAIPLDARLGGALLAAIFILPLLLYLIAGASHVILRLLGGTGTGFGARLALFCSLLAVTPLMLAQGLLVGLFGPQFWVRLVGGAVLAAFLFLWIATLRQVGFADQTNQG